MRTITKAEWSKLEAQHCREYEAWCGTQGLPLMSADELIHEDLSQEQRRYVSDFIRRWEQLMEIET